MTMNKSDVSILTQTVTNHQPIPLEKLCSLEVRELLEQGTPKGSGHNHSAIKVAKEVIGVESYCQAAGIPYQGTARELYESFLLASGIDSDSTTESRWKSAIAANPSPSLSDDKFENCLKAWNRQNGQNNQRVSLTHPQSPKKSKQSATLPPIEGPVKLARFDVSPSDYPQSTKLTETKKHPKESPQGATVTNKTYHYSPTQFIKRFDWEDKTKPKGRDKTFRQYCINQAGEETLGKGNDHWPAYRENEAIAAKDWVLFVEGEDTTDTARCELGLVATTFQGSNWSETAIAPALTRLKEAGCPGIVILPDHDKTGEEKGQKLLTVATKIGLQALIVPMTDLWIDCPDKGDLTDWIKWVVNQGGMIQNDCIERLEKAIEKAINYRLIKEPDTLPENECKELDPQWDYPDWWKKSFPKNNVVSINKNNPKANESSTLSDDLKALLDEGLSGSELDSKILSLAKLYKHTKKDVKDLYDKLSNEKERELELDFQKEVLDKLENQKVVKLNEVLPENFAKALAAIAKAYGVSESVLLTCLLPVACSQLNPDMRLTLRTSSKQQARPIFWGIIGGDPGSAKTPCLNLFTDPVKKIQKMEKERFDLDQEYYEKRRKEWEKLNKKEQQNEPEPEPPKPMKRKLIGKATFEAVLRVQVQTQDDSLLWAKDEMSELFNEFGQYKGGKGSDRQVLLSMSTGEGFSLDRVKEYLFAERSTTSIIGGIQPGILKKHMGDMQDEDGLFSRFCFDFIPSETPNKIEDGEVIPDVSGWLDDIYSRLRAIPPQTFTFEDEAQKKYNHWYNALDDARINEPRGAMKGIYAKYKTLTGVVALALHCLWAAIEGQSPSNKVSGEALYMAKKMMNLYLSNIKTFYQTASEDETAPLERILALSAKTDDYISATEVKQRDRFFKKISPDTIRAYFTDLTLMGKGEVTGKGKAIRFKKLDTFKGNLTENRQKLDRVKNSQNLTTTTVSEVISTKLDKLDNFSQANSENEPSPPVVIPDEVLPTKENVYLSSESPQPQTQQASQPLDTVSSSVYSSQDLSSNRGNQKDIWDDDYEVSDNQKTNNFKAGDRVRYSGTYGMVEATIKNIKTVSDQGNPLSCPLAVLDNETAIPLQQLTAIA